VPGIFISHISEESAIAVALQELLRAAFPDAFVFVSSDLASIPAGEDWYVTILNSVKEADVVLVLCSPLSTYREWINYEAGIGDGAGALVIPLVHGGLPKGKLSGPLSRKQAKSLESPDELVGVLNAIGGRLGTQPKAASVQDFVDKVKVLQDLIPKPVDAKKLEQTSVVPTASRSRSSSGFGTRISRTISCQDICGSNAISNGLKS